MVMRSRCLWPLTLVFVVAHYGSLADGSYLSSGAGVDNAAEAASSPSRIGAGGGEGEILLAAANQHGEIPDDVAELLQRDPSFVLGMLSKLRTSILKKPMENSKRGIDFGLGRGYSGNQAAKHFMGLVASQYAGGPGKRKRSDPQMVARYLKRRQQQEQHQQQMRDAYSDY